MYVQTVEWWWNGKKVEIVVVACSFHSQWCRVVERTMSTRDEARGNSSGSSLMYTENAQQQRSNECFIFYIQAEKIPCSVRKTVSNILSIHHRPFLSIYFISTSENFMNIAAEWERAAAARGQMNEWTMNERDEGWRWLDGGSSGWFSADCEAKGNVNCTLM